MTHNLNRFLNAQEKVYNLALREVNNGRKLSHWMWFIFPQIIGLGTTPTSKFYSIKNIEEARSYLSHPILGGRLREITRALLTLENKSAYEIFGTPDDLKLRSCMTLFDLVEPGGIFSEVIDKYFRGIRDRRTLEIVGSN